MIADFIFSVAGFSFLNAYKDKFNCSFRISEPSGSAVILDVGEKSYSIKEGDVEDFKAAVTESLKTERNVLLAKFKDSEINEDDDVVY